MIQKNELRKIFKEKRQAISKERREEAAQSAFQALKDKGYTLSFSPLGSEIDLSPLNAHLQSEGRLLLVPYQIDPLFQINFADIDCIFVPALAFDRNHFRLGYGKGFYDRFLAKAKNVLTIGVGFKEQLYEELLPKDPWDIQVQEMALF